VRLHPPLLQYGVIFTDNHAQDFTVRRNGILLTRTTQCRHSHLGHNGTSIYTKCILTFGWTIPLLSPMDGGIPPAETSASHSQHTLAAYMANGNKLHNHLQTWISVCTILQAPAKITPPVVHFNSPIPHEWLSVGVPHTYSCKTLQGAPATVGGHSAAIPLLRLHILIGI